MTLARIILAILVSLPIWVIGGLLGIHPTLAETVLVFVIAFVTDLIVERD